MTSNAFVAMKFVLVFRPNSGTSFLSGTGAFRISLGERWPCPAKGRLGSVDENCSAHAFVTAATILGAQGCSRAKTLGPGDSGQTTSKGNRVFATGRVLTLSGFVKWLRMTAHEVVGIAGVPAIRFPKSGVRTDVSCTRLELMWIDKAGELQMNTRHGIRANCQGAKQLGVKACCLSSKLR